MRYLLDECLARQTAEAMAAMSDIDTFAYIAGDGIGRSGATDDEIPGMCREGAWQVLITANVADFGARKHLYQSLLANGVHVLVIRPGKQKLDKFFQVSLLSRYYREYSRMFANATGPTLAIVTEGGVRQRSLAELVEEIQGDGRRRSIP